MNPFFKHGTALTTKEVQSFGKSPVYRGKEARIEIQEVIIFVN